jgi:hypothetical protein
MRWEFRSQLGAEDAEPRSVHEVREKRSIESNNAVGEINKHYCSSTTS